MRYLPLVVLLACAKSTPLPAAATPPAPAPEVEAAVAPPPKVNRELLVWRLTKGEAVSHLFGTCHLPIPLDDLLPDTTPLQTARVVFTELDIDAIDPIEAFEVMWDDERSHADALGIDRFTAISRTLHPTLPAPMIDRMEAWVVASMMLLDGMASDATATGALPVDASVASLAAEHGVELRFVETLAEQAEMMKGLGFDLAEEPTPDEAAAGLELMQAMQRLCLQGDTGVEALLTEEHDPTNAKLFADRNLAWFPKLLPELEQGGVFVAVGAGHMVGATGLVAQAEEAGFSVERLSGTVTAHEVPDAGVAPEPPSAERLPDEAVDQMVALAARQMCGEPGPNRDCLVPEGMVCEERVAHDVTLCVHQILATPADLEDPAMPDALANCMSTGLIGRALWAKEVGDGPGCAELIPGLTP